MMSNGVRRMRVIIFFKTMYEKTNYWIRFL